MSKGKGMSRNEGSEPTADELIQAIIEMALAEDIGDGDVTTICTVPESRQYIGRFVAKANGVLAGLDVATRTFLMVDATVQVIPSLGDGSGVKSGDVIAVVHGPGRALLSAERVALNFMQRMSGIATATRRYVDAVQGTSATILDTRKTAPGMRMLDKEAVLLGGGSNHRTGLFDMVLIKENHIAAAGGITAAVEMVRNGDVRGRPIEVEVRNLTELSEALSLHPDRIMLDNMDLAQMREAVSRVNGTVSLEASGNVSLETVASIAATGVDYISVGALTHSVRALDISFLLEIADFED